MRTVPAALSMAACLLLDSSAVDACSSYPELGADVGVLPANGSVAPRNARIWVPVLPAWKTQLPPFEPDDVVVEVGDTAIATARVTLLVDGEQTTPVLMLEPLELLPAGATVRVMLGDSIGSEFTVGTDTATAPPASPRIERIDVVGGYFGGLSCPVSSRVTVIVEPSDELLVLTQGAADRVPMTPLAIGHGTKVTAVDLADGEHALHLLAIDLAGNVTATAVPMFTVPTEQSGCSAGRGAGWLALVLAALTAAFARRREQLREMRSPRLTITASRLGAPPPRIVTPRQPSR